MHETEIRRLDRAALGLLQALDTYGEKLTPYLEETDMESLRGSVVNLRRVLLGLTMGILYQDWEPTEELLNSVAGSSTAPVDEAAAEVVNLLSRQQKEE